MKGVSGIDEAFASGGESLAKSWDDLGEVLTSEETKEALYYTLYSVAAILSGGITMLAGNTENDTLDNALQRISQIRMISPSSWMAGGLLTLADDIKLGNNLYTIYELTSELINRFLLKE